MVTIQTTDEATCDLLNCAIAHDLEWPSEPFLNQHTCTLPNPAAIENSGWRRSHFRATIAVAWH